MLGVIPVCISVIVDEQLFDLSLKSIPHFVTQCILSKGLCIHSLATLSRIKHLNLESCANSFRNLLMKCEQISLGARKRTYLWCFHKTITIISLGKSWYLTSVGNKYQWVQRIKTGRSRTRAAALNSAVSLIIKSMTRHHTEAGTASAFSAIVFDKKLFSMLPVSLRAVNVLFLLSVVCVISIAFFSVIRPCRNSTNAAFFS